MNDKTDGEKNSDLYMYMSNIKFQDPSRSVSSFQAFEKRYGWGIKMQEVQSAVYTVKLEKCSSVRRPINVIKKMQMFNGNGKFHFHNLAHNLFLLKLNFLTLTLHYILS